MEGAEAGLYSIFHIGSKEVKRGRVSKSYFESLVTKKFENSWSRGIVAV